MSSANQIPIHGKIASKSPQTGPSPRDRRQAHQKQEEASLFAGVLLNATAVPVQRPTHPEPAERVLTAAKQSLVSSRQDLGTANVKATDLSTSSKGSHRTETTVPAGGEKALERTASFQVPSAKTSVLSKNDKTTLKVNLGSLVSRTKVPLSPSPKVTGRRSNQAPKQTSTKAVRTFTRVDSLQVLRTVSNAPVPIRNSSDPASSLEGGHRRSSTATGSSSDASLLAQAPVLQSAMQNSTPTEVFHMASPTAPEQFTQLVLHQVTDPYQGGLVVQAQPAGLGQITVSVHELAGQFHVHVVVEQAQTLQWFNSQHQGLMENLANTGHDVSQMTFSMANEFSNSGQQGRAPRPTGYRAEGKSVTGAESVRISQRRVTSEHADGRWYV